MDRLMDGQRNGLMENPADKLEKLEWKDILNGTTKEEELTDEKDESYTK